MAGGSQSSSACDSAYGSALLAQFRDDGGFLPLAPSSKCGTRLIGRVSQKSGSVGMRFYKCPMLEHTPMACKFFMFEEHYAEFLVTLGILPPVFSKEIRRGEEMRGTGTDALKEANNLLKEAIARVENCAILLQDSADALKEAKLALKSAVERNLLVGANIDRIGERLLSVGLATLLLVLLVLVVLLVK